MKLKLILLALMALCKTYTKAQSTATLFVTDAIKTNRIKQYNNIVNNAILKNLSLPLSDSTEENWTDAFWAMELIQYKSPWAKMQINKAFDSVQKRGLNFQRALLELAYANFPNEYIKPVNILITNTADAKIFAMCSEYLLRIDTLKTVSVITPLLFEKFTDFEDNAIIKMLYERIKPLISKPPRINNTINYPASILKDVLNKNAFPNSVVVYSFQRKNRNYPGIAIVRDSTGNFIKDEKGNIIAIPQLARSISNLPGYLTNGNTPQGIFRMDGFDTSRANFIGPTTNIQLTMPFENTIAHFVKDSTITDSIWNESYYKNLLPDSWKNYSPIYQTYYASKAGRTEIIAHGTTVNPDYYKNEPYYPLTPTQGCLCTKEIWSEENGQRVQSNQQELVDAVINAGGPDGYLIVIELDDKNKPLTLSEILSYLNP